MADTRISEQRSSQPTAERGLQRRQTRDLALRDPFDLFRSGPFAMLRRMQDDMDRLFGEFGGRGWASPLGRGWISPAGEEGADWVPAIEAFQRGNEFVVRAEVPGLSRDDLNVEITEDALTIRGERKYDHEEEREGVYRSERLYGSFYRVVPLPEGTVTESAKASFGDGVLEVVVQAPSHEVRRGRKVDIGEARTDKNKQESSR